MGNLFETSYMTYDEKKEDFMNINEKVGALIRQFREAQGFSQMDFAAECQISRAYYGRIERGEHSMTLDTCEQIAKTLGVRLASLFDD